MAKIHRKRRPETESNSTYLLKVLLYFLLGLIWVKFNGRPVLPLGLVVGLLFAAHEHFQVDRKIEYAVLLVATLLGLSGAGIFLSLFV